MARQRGGPLVHDSPQGGRQDSLPVGTSPSDPRTSGRMAGTQRSQEKSSHVEQGSSVTRPGIVPRILQQALPGRESYGRNSAISDTHTNESQGLAETRGTPGLAGDVGPLGEAQAEASPVESEGPLVTGGPSAEHSQDDPSLQEHAPLVVRQGEHTKRDTVHVRPYGDVALHRRIKGGVGSPSTRGNGSGKVVPGGEDPPYKPARAPGSSKGPRDVRPSTSRKLSSPHVRQCHCSGIHKEAGRPEIKGIVQPHSSNPGMGRKEPHPSYSQVHSGKEKRTGRRPQQDRTSSRVGMVSTSASSAGGSPVVGFTGNRSVRHEVQCSVTRVLFSGARPDSSVRGRLPALVGRSRRIRFSSLRVPQAGTQQAQAVKGYKDDFGSALVAGEGVVRRSTGPGHTPSMAPSSKGRSTTSTALPKTARKPTVPAATRVEVIKPLLRKEGFSEKTASRMSGYLRKSLCVVYQAKWATFVKWCATQNLRPLDASVHRIADLMVHLRDDLGVSIPAINEVRAALGQVFQLRGINLGASHHISMLIGSFEQSCSPRASRVPQWDVAKVLKALSRPPFKPLKDILDKDLTLKAVFLLALASAKHVSELHGLSFEVSHSKGWKELSFKFLPEFVAKTQNPAVADPRFEEFSIPVIPHSDNPEDLLLCPVRTIRKYLSPVKRAVSKNTISFWLRLVTKRAYDSDGSAVPGTPRPHDIRGLSTSLAFDTNMAVGQVMRADTWARQSTFMGHYLKDCTRKSLDAFSIGPVISAMQQV
ncbi:uncharacterized protein [Palaemon carinicauda]|uniref:uncharacterized protein n=1 Tax=Palaemon carinicauda TaxID=392227 RepID=UPI0035B691E4